MERFEFDSKTGPNSNRKNGFTGRGVISLTAILGGIVDYPREHPKTPLMLMEINGPAGANRGAVIIDKATAGKLGAALLGWAGFNPDVPLLVSQIEWLAGLGLELCAEQEGLLNLLGALRDLFEQP